MGGYTILAIDDGGYSVGVIGEGIKESFYAVKSIYGQRNLTEIKGKNDFIIEYKGVKYVGGETAFYDSHLPLQVFGETKCHLFYDISVLTAIHQYGGLNNKIILNVPIKHHNTDEKKSRIERLKGTHTIKINGITKTFNIADILVAAEGASAFWINKIPNKSYYLDIGSRTINACSVLNINNSPRFIDSESDTFYKGIEALSDSYDPKALADYICGRLIRLWNKDSPHIYLLGGGCYDTILVDEIKKYFPNAQVMDEPHLANAKGLYELAKIAYS